jgi:hypothetical protein
MNKKREEEGTLSWKADAAFRQAAYKVIQRAKQTGTPVVIWEDDMIKEVSPEEVELRMPAKILGEERP